MSREKVASHADDLQRSIARIRQNVEGQNLTTSERRILEAALRKAVAELSRFHDEIDPIRQPAATFDPSDPAVVARFISIALVSQPRSDLEQMVKFYGSGVYALYYNGSFPLYDGLSKTETPIYVGQAAPEATSARTPREQGPRLARRLEEHKKSIRSAENLNVSDFEYRCLVVQSGWESAAENLLINLFRPIWNSEVNVLYGIGKHGDSATTRANKRSPWDTLHPGRLWAANTVENARDIGRIEDDVRAHFLKHPPFDELASILSYFIEQLRST